MKTYLSTNLSPLYNLALEEHILKNHTKGDFLLLWQSENAIVLGLHQNAVEEINQFFVHEKTINVVRRISGGGTVYHDKGNLNFSFITDTGKLEVLSMEKFINPVIKSLKGLGINAEFTGRNDIIIEGYKVSGSAQAIHRNRILHHGTLLFDSDLNILSKALKVDSDKFKCHSVKSVRSKVTNINNFLAPEYNLKDLKEHLVKSLAGGDTKTLKLKDSDIAEINKLVEDKYSRWEWNFGRSPDFTLTNKSPDGKIKVHLEVKEGLMENLDLRIESPNKAKEISDKTALILSSALKGIRYDLLTVSDFLKNNWPDILDGDGKKSFLRCLFNA